MSETQTLNEQPNAVPVLDGSEEAAIQAFHARRAPVKAETAPQAELEAESEETTSEADPADESDNEESDETLTGESEDESEAEALAEVEYEGKTYKVAPELQKALLRQSDYSRKMNEVGAKDKALTQRMEIAETLVQGAEKFSEVLAEIRGIDAEMKRYESVDMRALRETNPAEFAAVAAEIQMLRMNREEAARKASGIKSELSEAQQKTLDAKRGEMAKALNKHLPGWDGELGVKITRYAVAQGYTVEEISQITDPRVVLALDRARKYDAMQESKGALKAKAADVPKVAKPGQPVRRDSQGDAMAKFRKSSSDDDAVAVFLARAAQRRK